MSQKYEKLKTLLKELIQLDQPDLDFGLYRIMHAKSAEVTQFLDKVLRFGWRSWTTDWSLEGAPAGDGRRTGANARRRVGYSGWYRLPSIVQIPAG